MNKHRIIRVILCSILLLWGIGGVSVRATSDSSGRIMPEPPSSITVEEQAEGISLRWGNSGCHAYYLYRSGDSGKTWNMIQTVWATGTNVAYSDRDVTPNTTYQYRVQGLLYDQGQWYAGQYSDIFQGSLSIGEVSGLRATEENEGVVLSWSASRENRTFGIMRRSENGENREWIGCTTNINRYVDTTAEDETTYEYQVYPALYIQGRWYNGALSRAESITVSSANIQMEAPGNLTAENTDDVGITLHWTPDKQATAYIVYRQAAENSDWERLDAVWGSSYCDRSVSFGESYLYHVQSVKYYREHWIGGPVADIVSEVMSPVTPAEVKLQEGAGNQSLRISWNKAGRADVFGILRSESEAGDYVWIGYVEGRTAYTDYNLTPGKTYYYKVYAASYDGILWHNGALSDPVSGQVGNGASNLQVTGASFGSMEITWDPVPGVDGYLLWRQMENEGWEPIKTTTVPNARDYPDLPEKQYSYMVQNLYYVDGEWGYGAYSNSATGMTLVGEYLAKEETTDQLIFVVGDGSAWGADFFYYEKTESGWSEIMETEAHVGYMGFNPHTIEGDLTTPTGRYALGLAFGNKANPGTALEWVDVTPYHYWIDDVESDYYNLLIDSRITPTGWNSGEHLIESTKAYNYAINIEVNPEQRKDSTSAIFLHCFSAHPYSQGCIEVDESYMIALLGRLQPGSEIVVMADPLDFP